MVRSIIKNITFRVLEISLVIFCIVVSVPFVLHRLANFPTDPIRVTLFLIVCVLMIIALVMAMNYIYKKIKISKKEIN